MPAALARQPFADVGVSEANLFPRTIALALSTASAADSPGSLNLPHETNMPKNPSHVANSKPKLGDPADQITTNTAKCYLVKLQIELVKLQRDIIQKRPQDPDHPRRPRRRRQRRNDQADYQASEPAGNKGCRPVETVRPRVEGQWYFQRYVSQLPRASRKWSCSTAAGTIAPVSSA